MSQKRDKRGVTVRHGERDTWPDLPQKRAGSLSNARARAHALLRRERSLSRIGSVTQRDVTVGLRDSDTTALPPRHGHGDRHGNSSQRTDIAKSVLEIARRVLDNVKAGRVYPQGTVEWAEQIVRGNTPPATSRAPAHAFPGVQA